MLEASCHVSGFAGHCNSELGYLSLNIKRSPGAERDRNALSQTRQRVENTSPVWKDTVES